MVFQMDHFCPEVVAFADSPRTGSRELTLTKGAAILDHKLRVLKVPPTL